MTTEQQVKNAIKWIDALKGGKKGFKKTIGVLGEDNDEDGEPDEFCCLGVACKVLDVKVNDWYKGTEPLLVNILGLNDEEGEFNERIRISKTFSVENITSVNDDVYTEDETFTNIRKFILKHLDKMFIPSVAQQLIKHYKK